jgi:hypothetical protein
VPPNELLDRRYERFRKMGVYVDQAEPTVSA